MYLFKKIFKQTIAVLLCICILGMQGCSKEQKTNPNMTGEQMFREIMLFQGENLEDKMPYFSATIHLLENSDETGKAERAKICDEIIHLIKASNPKYFDEFKRVIESDNLYEINKALVGASSLTIKQLKTIPKYSAVTKDALAYMKNNKSKYNLKNKSDAGKMAKDLNMSLSKSSVVLRKSSQGSTQEEAIALAVAAVVAAVVWEVAVAVNVVAVATVGYKVLAVWGAEGTESESGLDNELVVAAIAENY